MPPISLEPVRQSDAAAIYEAIIESHAELRPWMPWVRSPHPLSDVEEWVRFCETSAPAGDEIHFCIRDGAGEFLGDCGISQRDRLNRTANVGYWVRTAAARRGIATRAVGLLIQEVWRTTDIQRLEIRVAVENGASRRVAEKLGAAYEGIARHRFFLLGRPVDAAIYSLLRPSDNPEEAA